jgi:hypothetical protein
VIDNLVDATFALSPVAVLVVLLLVTGGKLC